MHEAIYDPCDHGMILHSDDHLVQTLTASVSDWEGNDDDGEFVKGVKLLTVNFSPTAENLACYWFMEVQLAITDFFRRRNRDRAQGTSREATPLLKCMRVWETPNCLAIYPSE